MKLKDAKILYDKGGTYREMALRYFTKEDIDPTPVINKLPKRWEDIKKISGYYTDESSNIEEVYRVKNCSENKSIFANKKQVESALAFAQLSQLAEVMNDGWVPDFNNKSQPKYVIIYHRKNLEAHLSFNTKYHICFKTQDLAEFSLKYHTELWKKYWMIDDV